MEEARRQGTSGRAYDPNIINIEAGDDPIDGADANGKLVVGPTPDLSYEQWMYPSIILRHPHRTIWRSLELDARLAMTIHDLFRDPDQHYRILDSFPVLMGCSATCSLTGATVYLGSNDVASLENAVSWLNRVYSPYVSTNKVSIPIHPIGPESHSTMGVGARTRLGFRPRQFT